MNNAKMIVIVGATASGKSSLALHVAERWNGELICADSRTIYKGMDIGTAKPSEADQARVPHHLLDVVEPNKSYSAADFKQQATAVIADIEARGKLPILVGGTGLYIDAVLYDFQFRESASPEQRAELEALNVEELQQKIISAGLPLPRNEQNPRHLIRVIETNGQIGERGNLRPNTIVIGLKVEPEVLKQRIAERVEQMFENRLEAEVQGVADKYGWEAEALKAIGYREFKPYFDGTQSLEQVKQQIITDTNQYAKRQRTWFKRNSDIQWFYDASEALEFLTKSVIDPSSTGNSSSIIMTP